MSEHMLALSMVGTLFVLFMFGFPVAFTLGGVALLFGFIGLDPVFLNLLPQRIYGIMTNFTLLAVPLFIFMGVTLERSGLAEDLLQAMALLFGRVRGGLAFAVVIAGALLAASTGIVGASVVTMGLISLPVMLRRGYTPTFSSGLICASGTLGQIIPPSIVLVLLGDIMGVSVGELFIASVIPGLCLVGAYLLYSYILCQFFGGVEEVPSEQTVQGKELVLLLAKGLLPPGFLIIAVLGSIFFGVASPTEAASIGAFGALLLALLHRRLTRENLSQVMQSTVKVTCMVFWILVGASLFGLVFRGLGGDEVIREAVLNLSNGKIIFLVVVMLLIFVLGFFLDFIEIVFIVIPILVPLVEDFGINKLWFSVLIAMNLQTSFLTPPLGFSLFYLRGIAPPGVTSRDIYKGIVPFVGIQVLILGLIIAFPEIVTWLPAYADKF